MRGKFAPKRSIPALVALVGLFTSRATSVAARRATAVAILFVAFGVMPAVASGAGWVIQPTPNPSGSKSSLLLGVSCASATSCTDVGTDTNSGGIVDVTLAERWDGTRWSIPPTHVPSQATGSFLNAASCTSSAACTAVGYSTDTFGEWFTLAERWDGTSWAIQGAPSPSGLDILYGVSCPSATLCTAVGIYQNAAGLELALAERWDGTSWAIQPTPNPTGATYSYLAGVSCPSTTLCTAVGFYINSAGSYVSLAERWNGTSWTVQPTPNPPGAKYTNLTGVSCASATACSAVGQYTNSAGKTLSLVERWNGTSWAIQPIPNPTGAKSSALTGVSCTAAGTCTAVGGYVDSTGAEKTLAERLTGTSWTIQPTPTPTGTRIQVTGVSCTSATVCTAVGNYRNAAGIDKTLAERSS